ncbi:MAG: bifunctional nuclease family protein [Planctomycetes bacterium]|nr:bifunctional nuclease family protein [Planctomycetota bacterium]
MSRSEVRLCHVVVYDTQDYQMIQLEEANGDPPRILTMMIGLQEAKEISRTVQAIKLPRPLTHTLFAQTIGKLGGTIEEVEIREIDMTDSTYFATLRIRQGDQLHELDARPSDCIALAQKLGARIYVRDEVWQKLKDLPPLPDA